MASSATPMEAAKQALRVAVRARRKAFASGLEAPAATAAIAGHVLGLRADWRGIVVAAYETMGSEVPTTGLIDALEHAGATVLLPHVVGPSGTALSFGAGAQVPHIVLVPLVAFDRSGARLGQGGGYYDATLAAWRAEGRGPVTVGVAFACQMVDAIPQETHDQLLHWIVTQHGAYATPATDRTDA